MSKLDDVLKKFYKDHQITKNKNIIKMWNDKNYSFDNDGFAPKCVSIVFDMKNKPWCRATVSSSTKQERCYYTRSDIFVNFGTIAAPICDTNNVKNKPQKDLCAECYKFCIEEHFGPRGEFKLKNKKKKSWY